MRLSLSHDVFCNAVPKRAMSVPRGEALGKGAHGSIPLLVRAPSPLLAQVTARHHSQSPSPSTLEAAPRHNADRHSAQVQGLHVHDAHSVATCS